jgi:HK97 family phage major capsid protein
MQALTDRADAEKRDFTTEEEREWNEREAEAKSLTQRIEKEGVLAQFRAEESRSIPAAAGAYEAADDTQSVQAEQKRSDGKRWGSLGDFLKAVVDAGTPGKRFDPRLRETRGTPSGASEQVSADGGFLVDTDFASELLTRVYNSGVLASRCRRIPISAGSNGLKINVVNETSRADGSRFGGVRAYWLAEADAYTASKPVFRQMSFSLYKLGAAMYLTDELSSDTSALQSLVEESFAKEMAFALDEAVLNGDGSGKPRGIRAATGSGIVTVAKEAAQAAATVNKENLFNMYSRCFGANRPNAVWFINQAVETQLFGLTLGNNGIYFPAGQFANSPYATLFGLPVIPVEQCAALGTVGDVVLADMSEYMLVEKGGTTMQSSVHVRFLYDEQVLKFTYRVDGQPTWASALTPKNGAATLAPYIQLATRA